MVPSDESEQTQLSLDLSKISRFHFKTTCKKHSGIIYHYMELIYDFLILNCSLKVQVCDEEHKPRSWTTGIEVPAPALFCCGWELEKVV